MPSGSTSEVHVAILEVCATEARRGISGQCMDRIRHNAPGYRFGEQISAKISLWFLLDAALVAWLKRVLILTSNVAPSGLAGTQWTLHCP